MSRGSSWPARGTDLARIRLALQRGDVRWLELPGDWLRANLRDLARDTPGHIVDLMRSHVETGGSVRGQKNVPGKDYHDWFSVSIPIDSRQLFVKFAIDPDEDSDPGLVVLNAHWTTR